MKKMLMVFLGVMFTVSLVGCGSSEEKIGKDVASVGYEYLKKEYKDPKTENNSNVTVYEDKGAYFLNFEKMEKRDDGSEYLFGQLFKVKKHKDNKYSVDDVSDTNPHDVDLDSLSIIYETKNVEIK